MPALVTTHRIHVVALPGRTSIALAQLCGNRGGSARDRCQICQFLSGVGGFLQTLTDASAKQAGRAASGSCNSDRHVG
jgi:hypothetical protein